MASVSVERVGDRVRMQVTDDGAGFDVATARPDRFGLVGMSERARLLGGELRITTSLAGGTTIEADMPLRGGFSVASAR